jgi:hypothetical protein
VTLALTATAAVTALSGCDAPYQQFLGAIPTCRGEPRRARGGVSGHRRRLEAGFRAGARARRVRGVQRRGPGDAFPGTSDYCWTRTLRAGALGGYELQYFDPRENAMQKEGLAGVAAHPIEKGLVDTLAVYQRFDFSATVRPGCSTATSIRRRRCARRWTRCSTPSRRAGGRRITYWPICSTSTSSRTWAASTRRSRRSSRSIAGSAHSRPTTGAVPFHDLLRSRQRASALAAGRSQADLTDVGVRAVDALTTPVFTLTTPIGDTAGGDSPPLEAVPVVHVRVNYVAVHADRRNVPEIAERASRHGDVDLAVARLADATDGAQRFGVWRHGERFTFSRDAAGRDRR